MNVETSHSSAVLDIADRCPVNYALAGEIKVRTHAAE